MSPAKNGKARCFAVRRGDVTSVANAYVLFSKHYGDLKELAACRYPLGTIGDMLSVVQDGLHGVRNYVPEGVPLIGVGNVTEDGIDLTEVNRITPEEHERLAASQVAPGDLLVTITGRLGTASIYESSAPANLSAHVALCRARPQHELLYLKHYLASRFGAASLTTAQIGSTHPHINVRRLVELPIPLPPQPQQREYAAMMEAARAARRTKLAEADALLASLDRFLLDALDLTPPPEDARKAYGTRLAQARTRLDADFHSPKFNTIRRAIEQGHYPAKRIEQLCIRMEAGFAAGKQDQAFDFEAGIPHLRPLNLNIYGEISIEITKFVPKVTVSIGDICQKGEVLFNNTNSTEMVGKSAVFELDQPCVCSNHMTRLTLGPDADPHFLAALFNALRGLGYLGLLSTNFNNQAGINLDTLKSLQVPCPPINIQHKISDEVRRRRQEAHRMRAEAEADWRAAKRWFEEQLLGGAQA